MSQHDLSPDLTARLTKFREKIDAIDRQLIALLKKRIMIVMQVGDMKRQESDLRSFIRSGREADMLRAVYHAFEGSDFHPLAATAIWRQIIAASTHCEQPLQAAILEDSPQSAGYWLTREYFGSFANVESVQHSDQLWDFCASHQGGIAVVAYPQRNSPAPNDLWWQRWLALPTPRPRIFGCLPFTTSDERPEALILAHIMPEATEDDLSLFVLETPAALKEDELQPWAKAKGEKAEILQSNLTHQLITVDGYHHAESELIQQLRLDFPHHIKHIHYLGSYARPIAINTTKI